MLILPLPSSLLAQFMFLNATSFNWFCLVFNGCLVAATQNSWSDLNAPFIPSILSKLTEKYYIRHSLTRSIWAYKGLRKNLLTKYYHLEICNYRSQGSQCPYWQFFMWKRLKHLSTPESPSLSKIATFSMTSNTVFAVSKVLSILYYTWYC